MGRQAGSYGLQYRLRTEEMIPGGCYGSGTWLVDANGVKLSELVRCPLCCNPQAELDPSLIPAHLADISTGYHCLCCGTYVLEDHALSGDCASRAAIGEFDTLAFVSGVVREITERRRRKERVYELSPQIPVPVLVASLKLTTAVGAPFLGIAELIASGPLSVSERRERTLKTLAAMSDHHGKWIALYPEDYSLACSRNAEAFTFWLKQWEIEGLLECEWSSGTTPSRSAASVMLTVNGWQQAESGGASVYGWPTELTVATVQEQAVIQAEDNSGRRAQIVRDNQDYLRRLVVQLRARQGIVPFVGAGASIALGLLGWSAFLRRLASEARRVAPIKKLVREGSFEEAAALLESELTPFHLHSSIEQEYGDHRLENAPPSDIATSLLRLSSGPILTTNFDRAIEMAATASGSPFERVICGARPDASSAAFRAGKRVLVKLHGDWEERSDRVLTISEYEQAYGVGPPTNIDLTRPLPRLLHKVFVGSSLLFVGCGLAQDRTIATLRTVAGIAQEISHFAIVEAPASLQKRKELARRLSGLNILPIWYPAGDHGAVLDLLKYLESTVSGGGKTT